MPGDVTTPQSAFNSLSAERVYDPPINANVTVAIPSLPATGFPPDRVTELPPAPAGHSYADLGGLVLDIPALQLSLPIVGVPSGVEGWDLTWLWDQAGYLEGTAYPTHTGNSALTAHVTLPNGRPGPFARLKDLRWGDRILVRAFGQVYAYEVRAVTRVNAGDLRSLAHKERAWLTLVTCHTYDEASGRYLHRWVVQAVLISVTEP